MPCLPCDGLCDRGRRYHARDEINAFYPFGRSGFAPRMAVRAQTDDVLSIQKQIRALSGRNQMVDGSGRISTLPTTRKNPLAKRVPIQDVNLKSAPACKFVEPIYRVALFAEAIPFLAFRASTATQPWGAPHCASLSLRRTLSFVPPRLYRIPHQPLAAHRRVLHEAGRAFAS